jgi:hypothetical protein
MSYMKLGGSGSARLDGLGATRLKHFPINYYFPAPRTAHRCASSHSSFAEALSKAPCINRDGSPNAPTTQLEHVAHQGEEHQTGSSGAFTVTPNGITVSSPCPPAAWMSRHSSSPMEFSDFCTWLLLAPALPVPIRLYPQIAKTILAFEIGRQRKS